MENPEKDPEEEDTETGEVTAEGAVIKVVINLKGNRATVGVQSTGCDPVFGTVEGNRDEIVQGALKILGEAEEKWKTTPRQPKSQIPASAGTTATPRPAPSPTKREPTKPTAALF